MLQHTAVYDHPVFKLSGVFLSWPWLVSAIRFCSGKGSVSGRTFVHMFSSFLMGLFVLEAFFVRIVGASLLLYSMDFPTRSATLCFASSRLVVCDDNWWIRSCSGSLCMLVAIFTIALSCAEFS